MQQIVYPVRYAGIGYTIEQHRYTANTLKYVHQRSSINQNLDHIRKIKMMNEEWALWGTKKLTIKVHP